MSLTLEELVYSLSSGMTFQCLLNKNSFLWFIKTQTSPNSLLILGTLQFTVPWLFSPSLMESHPFHSGVSIKHNTRGVLLADFRALSPSSSLLSRTLTLKFQRPHSSKIPNCISFFVLLEILLPSLQSGKCFQTESSDQHKVHTVYFPFLMNHSPALPIV